MSISRKGFLRAALAAVTGLWAGGVFGRTKLFAQAETANEQEKMYKNGDIVPQAGRYQCAVCGFIVEYLPKHIEKGVTFGICTVCKSGTDDGPKKSNEEFWKYIGEKKYSFS